MAGSFNNWRSGVKLHRFDLEHDASVIMPLVPGNYEASAVKGCSSSGDHIRCIFHSTLLHWEDICCHIPLHGPQSWWASVYHETRSTVCVCMLMNVRFYRPAKQQQCIDHTSKDILWLNLASLVQLYTVVADSHPHRMPKKRTVHLFLAVPNHISNFGYSPQVPVCHWINTMSWILSVADLRTEHWCAVMFPFNSLACTGSSHWVAEA